MEEAVNFMKAHGLVELTWEKEGAKISLKTHASAFNLTYAPHQGAGGSMPMGMPQSSGPAISDAAPAALSEPKKNQLQILSPFVGTFYKSPAPGSDPYVAEGQSVRPGDVLCIVEAMKLMNEIESEVTGRIVRILAEDGQPVEYGEPLFVYEK